jgi:hypothetical protein
MPFFCVSRALDTFDVDHSTLLEMLSVPNQPPIGKMLVCELEIESLAERVTHHLVVIQQSSVSRGASNKKSSSQIKP